MPVVTGQRGGQQGDGASLTEFGHVMPSCIIPVLSNESSAVKAGAAHIRALSTALAEHTTATGVIKPRRLTLSLDSRRTVQFGLRRPVSMALRASCNLR